MPSLGSRCPHYTPQDIQYIIDHIGRIPTSDIAHKLGRTTGAIWGLMKEKGIRIRRGRKTAHIPLVPRGQFYCISTPEIAYLLGYMWADGHTSDRAIMLGHCLKTDMDNIAWIVAKTGKWKRYERAAGDRMQAASRFITHDKVLTRYLGDKLGYDDKSLCSPMKVLRQIPDHLKHYWWRGYFDGDGCITAPSILEPNTALNVNISGAHDQDWTEGLRLADSLFVKAVVDQRANEEGRSSSFIVQGTQGALRFFAYLYQGRETDGIGLDRKYQRYLAFKAVIAQRRRGGHMGVQPVAGRAVYVAKMKHDYEGKYLGFFKTEEEAARAYDLAAIRRYGCYADTNFPIETYMPFMAINTATAAK